MRSEKRQFKQDDYKRSWLGLLSRLFRPSGAFYPSADPLRSFFFIPLLFSNAISDLKTQIASMGFACWDDSCSGIDDVVPRMSINESSNHRVDPVS